MAGGEGVLAMLQNVPRAYVLVAVLLLLGVGVGTWVYMYFFDTYHYAVVNEGVLYRDGVKNMRQFHMALDKSQAKVVVMLVDEKEFAQKPFTEEWEYFQRSKVTPVLIPIKLGGYPTTEDVQKFLDMVEKSGWKKKPVLVHCAQGIRRTGMMVAAYQMSVMKWDKQKTKDAILAFGHSDRTINDIKKFIDVYDPEKKQVTQDLGMSKEKE